MARPTRLRCVVALTIACLSGPGPSTRAAEHVAKSVHAAGGPGQTPDQALVPGTPVERPLTAPGRHAYALLLKAGDYLELRADSFGLDVAVTIYAPDQSKLGDAAYRQEGPKRLAIIATVDGSHRVEVAAIETGEVSGRYRLAVGNPRTATAQDPHRVAAATLFAAGETLRDDWKATSNTVALERYRAALRHWSEAGEVAAEATTLRRLGDAHRALGQSQDALDRYRSALERARQAKEPAEECRVLNALSRVHLELGDDQAAIQHANAALESSRTIGDLASEAEALNNVGDVYALLGRTRESLDLYAGALAASERSGNRRGCARSWLNLGYSHSDLSRVDDALASYDRALMLWTTLADRHEQAATLNALGHLHSKLGERQQALGCYLRARDLFTGMGEPLGEGITYNGLGLVYFELGEVRTALEHYEQQLRLHRAAHFLQGEASALAHVGRCLYSQGDLEKALAQLTQSVTILESIRDRKVEAFARGLLGQVHEARGEAESALESYERSAAVSRVIGDRREESYALNRIARLLHRMGRSEEALDHLGRARALSSQSSDRVGESLTLHNIATIENDRRHYDVALERIRESLQLSESLRTDVASLELRASYVASVRERHEFLVALLMRLHEQQPTRGYDRLAFEASERARARSFLDGLAQARSGIREGIDPRMLEQETSLRRALNARAERLTRLGGSAADKEERSELEREIGELTTVYRELEAVIRAASPRYAALTQPRPLNLEEVQRRVVDEESVLLQYFLGDRQSYLWAITPETIESYVLPGRERIETLVGDVRATLVPSGASRRSPPAPGQVLRASQQATELGRLLLGPAVHRLAGKRLLIAADGALHLAPFAALPVPAASRPESGSGVPLIVEHEIVYLPSPSTLALVRGEWDRSRHWPRSVVVLADPVFEADDPRIGRGSPTAPGRSTSPVEPMARALRDVGGLAEGAGIPRLLDSRREARAIASLLPDAQVALDFDASRSTATSPELSRYRIVHIATHGIVDNDHPDLSGIILSLFDEKGRPQDGFLRLHDIYNLNLPADLVVLSACSTALGRAVSGEGLIGLVRGFMYAGSRRVLASLWNVDDEATGELMRRFYTRMFRNNEAPSAALRAAQLEMLGQKRWSEARYWAAWVLQGEWQADGRPVPGVRQ